MENDTNNLAMRLHPDDTVAVVIQSVERGSKVTITGPGAPSMLTAVEDIACYHKLSLVALRPGQTLMRNGIAIGRATEAIKAGACVHTHNLASLRAL